MPRSAAVLLAVCLLAGCHAPLPKFQPLAGYGPARVPPPSTSSYGQAAAGGGDAYYPGGLQGNAAPAAQTPAGYPSRAAVPGSGNNWQAVDPISFQAGGTAASLPDQGVMQAVAIDPAGGGIAIPSGAVGTGLAPSSVPRQPSYTVAGTSAPAHSSPVYAGGMTVNDATSAEPARFVAPSQAVEITSLPPASGGTTNRAGGFAAPPAAAAIPTSTSPPADNQWRPKYSPGG